MNQLKEEVWCKSLQEAPPEQNHLRYFPCLFVFDLFVVTEGLDICQLMPHCHAANSPGTGIYCFSQARLAEGT